MPRTNLFLTRTQVAVSLALAIVLVTVAWLASCHVSTPMVDMTTPTAISVRQLGSIPTVVQPTLTPTVDAPAVAPRPACQQTPLAEAGEIVVGALVPLSRPGAIQSGFAMQTAFNLAVEELNTQGGVAGKRLRLIAYDTAGLPEQGARFAEQLITQDCAVALVGVYHSHVAVAVKEVVRRLGVPMIFVDPYVDEITVDRIPQIFRIAPTTSMLAQMPGQWLAEVGDYNQDGEKFVVVVAENSAMGSAKIESAEKWLPHAGFTVGSVLVNLPITDNSSEVARIVALEHMPDAIFFYLHNDAVYDLVQALITAGIGPQKNTLLVMYGKSSNDQTFWERVPAGRYVVVPHIGPWPTAVTPKGQRFANQYRTYFDRWPEAYAFAAYDSVFLVADAISRTQSLAPDAIITALEESDIDLAAGHYTFPYNSQNPPDGTTAPAYLWHQWPNPPLYYLQYTEPQQSAVNAAIIWPPAQRTSPGPVVRAPTPAP